MVEDPPDDLFNCFGCEQWSESDDQGEPPSDCDDDMTTKPPCDTLTAKGFWDEKSDRIVDAWIVAEDQAKAKYEMTQKAKKQLKKAAPIAVSDNFNDANPTRSEEARCR